MSANRLVRISHRGGGSSAPENSLEGIERGLASGVEMIEVDVRATSDGVIVLAHDERVHSTSRRVSEHTWDELRSLDRKFAMLDEALQLIRGRARLNLDVKEPSVVESMLRVVKARNCVDDCIVSCLEPGVLTHVSAIEPAMERFLSYPADRGGASSKPWLKPAVEAVVSGMRLTLPTRLPGMLRPLPGTHATIYHKLVTRRLMDAARRLGIKIYTWTIDEPAEIARVVALGVAGVTSNRLDLLAGLARGDVDLAAEAPGTR
jgi:glycerophosphoryl diester phosphodiesterase